uniref:Uncharacterized protein n=1 Tax=Amphimedon queenslandica TaxID=400682 RepID=A0A1X7U0E8_AMPQE
MKHAHLYVAFFVGTPLIGHVIVLNCF